MKTFQADDDVDKLLGEDDLEESLEVMHLEDGDEAMLVIILKHVIVHKINSFY